MIEAIMYFAIGFFVAVVIGLGLFPLVHNRAVRLTGLRLEAATPLSMAEIQAEKDQLRAKFAMSTRRLEMNVEQLKLRTSNQLSELGKKTDAINRLKMEIGEKAAAIFTMEAREQSLRSRIGTLEEDFAAKDASLQEAQVQLTNRQAEIDNLARDLGERTHLTDSQRIELVALRTQMESLQGQIGKLETDIRYTEDRLTLERTNAEAAARDLHTEREQSRMLEARSAELEQQLATRADETLNLGRKILELEARLSEQGRKLGEREYEIIRLRTETEAAQRTEVELRDLMAAMEDRHNGVSSRLRAENSVLASELAEIRTARDTLGAEIAALRQSSEESLAGMRNENVLLRERIEQSAAEITRLQSEKDTLATGLANMRAARDTFGAEIATLRQSSEESLTGMRNENALLRERIENMVAEATRLRADNAALDAELSQIRTARETLETEVAQLRQAAEDSMAGERDENALLRERIDHVAAEIARLTMTLEGSGSPIEALLAAPPRPVSETAPGSNGKVVTLQAPPTSPGNLADRIRDLQARAPRVASTPS